MSEHGMPADGVEQLAQRAAAGDDVAFGRLARAIRPQLLRWALVHTRDADDAEDVVQAALLRARRGLASFHQSARLSTWLYTIVRSAAADWRRSERRRHDRNTRYAGDVVRSIPPAETDDRARLLELVRAQLGSLPARQREVFDLADLQGHTPAAVAEMLGMSPSTVRVHLLRARRLLRARLIARHAQLVEDA